LRLRSGLTLRLAPGAILRALPEPSRYPHYTHPIASRMDAYPRRAFLFGYDLEDVTLSGEGLIDFSGDHPAFQDRVGDSPDRPYGLLLVACRRVRLENLRLRNSAYWMIRLLRCRDVRIRDLDVFNHANLNNDGLDIDSCEDVVVSGCHIDSSDDGIVLKSETPHPCRNIIVADCLVASHASAIKLGTASLGGFENVLVHHCIIRPSRATVVHHPFQYVGGMTGLDIVSVDGGPVRDVHFDHIVMEGVANPLFVRLGQRHSTLSVPKNRRREDATATLSPVTGAGRIERLSFTHIHAHDVGPMPGIIAGFENHPLRDLTFRDIRVRLAPGRTFDPDVSPDWNPEAYPCAHLVAGARGGLDAQGFVFRHIEGLTLENVVVEAPPGDPRPTLSRHQA
jgi:polygalacturonase